MNNLITITNNQDAKKYIELAKTINIAVNGSPLKIKVNKKTATEIANTYFWHDDYAWFFNQDTKVISAFQI